MSDIQTEATCVFSNGDAEYKYVGKCNGFRYCDGSDDPASGVATAFSTQCTPGNCSLWTPLSEYAE